jgi:hypothetical protein
MASSHHAGSQQIGELLPSHLAIPQDFLDQTRPNGFSCVDGDYRCSPIGVPHEVMAGFDPNHFKAGLLQGGYDLLSCQCRQLLIVRP